MDHYGTGAAEDFDGSTDRMWTNENYLEALRQGVGLEELEETGRYSDFTLNGDEPEEEEKEFLDELQEAAKAFLEEQEETQGPLNAQVCVKVAPNNMAAWIFIFPPAREGKDITEDLILDALSACGVLYGVDEPAVHYAARRKTYLKLIDAARGRNPVDGKAGSIIDHYPRLQVVQDDEMGNLEDESRAFEKSELLHTIHKGDVICDLQMPVYSKDGITVSGEIIKGKEIPALDLPMGENTGFNQNMSEIVSEINGTLIFDSGKFVVKDMLNLFSNVNNSTGNMETIGNLTIHGDVQNGVSVRATGNIMIQGMVANANVIAGGDIIIGMGIRGTKGAILKAGGNVECRYIENCTVRARGYVRTDSIINCEVHSDEYVEVKKLVGSSVFALHKVAAKEVGIKQRKDTSIFLGVTQEKLKERENLEYRIHQLEEERRERTIDIRMLRSKSRREEGDEEKLYQLLNRNAEQEQEIQEYVKRVKQLERVVNDMSSCEFTASLLRPPVKVMTLSDSIFINREENMCRVWSDEGELRMF